MAVLFSTIADDFLFCQHEFHFVDGLHEVCVTFLCSTYIFIRALLCLYIDESYSSNLKN